jgi:hypothetical protein
MPPRKAKAAENGARVLPQEEKKVIRGKKGAKKTAKRANSDDDSDEFDGDVSLGDTDLALALSANDGSESTKPQSRAAKSAPPSRKVLKTNAGGDVKEEEASR